MKTFLKYIAFTLLIASFGACGNGNLKTVATQTSDNYNIVILSANGSVTHGSGKFYLEFHNAKDNQLVDVGKVEVNATMQMPGMPMVNDADVRPAETPGRYSVQYNFSMGGTWTLNIKYDTDKTFSMSLMVN